MKLSDARAEQIFVFRAGCRAMLLGLPTIAHWLHDRFETITLNIDDTVVMRTLSLMDRKLIVVR